MSHLSTILIRKGDKTTDILAEYGYATGKMDYPIVTDIKEFSARNVPGENGERVFFPETSSLNPYDIEVEFKYYGRVEPNRALFIEFRDYLTGRDGKGTEMSIYFPYYRVGRQKVYVKSINYDKFHRDEDEAFASFKVTFRVTDPETDILLSTD